MSLVPKLSGRDNGVRDREGRIGPRRFKVKVEDSIRAESSEVLQIRSAMVRRR